MKRIIFCLMLLCSGIACGQSTNVFPNFTDVLLIEENGKTGIYVEGEPKVSLTAMQAEIDERPMQKKKEGVLLRFDHRKIPLKFVVEAVEKIYRCGVPAVYLYDLTRQYNDSQIAADPFLFGLNQMPSYNKFLRILDVGKFLLLPNMDKPSALPPLPSNVSPIIYSILIALLAFSSYIGGLYLSRLKGPWWLAGYVISLTAIVLIALGRWIPTLEMHIPFSLLMKSRREYIIISIVTALLLAMPAARLQKKMTAIAATGFAALCVLYFAILPFLLPVFNRDELLALNTGFDRYGACIQNTGYTSGPAAAVSALREFDIPAEEGVIAVFAFSTSSAGTPRELLCKAISNIYAPKGINCRFRSFMEASEMKNKVPVIAVMNLGLLVDHYVTVLRVTDDYITVADPAGGMRTLSIQDFESTWRNQGIVVEKTQTPSSFHGTGSIPLDKE